MSYGITEDTGGHITYILGEMRALAQRSDVAMAEIVTRLFDEPELGAIHKKPTEDITHKLRITRIDSGNQRYLSKEELSEDRDAFLAALLSELRERDRLPDLVHAHFADAAEVARHVHRELGIPFVYTPHSLGIDKREAGCASNALDARIAQENAAIHHASAIIGSSRDECERQICAYPSARLDRIHRIVPGIETKQESDTDMQTARDLIAPFLNDADKPIVLAIARPVQKKNLAALVQAFGENADLRSCCNLVILAGQRGALDGARSEQAQVLLDLLKAIDRYDLYGSIAYPKQHDARHVAGLYRIAASNGGVFVNPALVEPYGLTICEAAAYGVPVVATNRGGPADIIAELEHGVTVDPSDTDGIADAVHNLIDEPQKWSQLSTNGLRNSASMNWDRYADRFITLVKPIVMKLPAVAKRSQKPTSLVVSDLDNTLTGCGNGAKRIDNFFKRRSQFGFVAATGRSIIEAQRIVREWGLPQPLAWITSTGSEIYWQRDGELVHDDEYFHAIARYWDGGRIDEALSDINGLVSQPIYEQREAKCSFFYDDRTALDRVKETLKLHDLDARVIPSHDRLLDILPFNAGKGAAMKHVARMLNVPRHLVFAIGDSGNDSDMLMDCENAVMVGNYAPELSALANRKNVYVARRHHGAGALEGIFAHRSRQKLRDREPMRAR